MKEGQKLWTREDFMEFFRNDETLGLLTPDDRVEIFCQIMLGSMDFTKKLLENVLGDYGIDIYELLEINRRTKTEC
jgi:hypothetical protein